ncbi:MAG: hypothetical protein ACYSWR_06275 [Planctomycetota bacterium]
MVLVVFGLCGCAVVNYFKREKPPYDTELYEVYSLTELKTSSAAEVLGMIHDPECELLSQSKSVIASFGQKKKGYKRWFNMVAFDENELTARRKYFFIVDEKSKGFPFMPKRRLRFESKMIMERGVLGEPYADQNARRLAILRDVLANLNKDTDEVKADNKQLDVCRMLINQTLEAILQKLEESPVLASKLSDAKGVRFDHITLGKGSIRMDVAGDVVDVRVRVDAFADKFQDPFSLRE